jgi:large subunit ribosomal protein L9
MQVILLENVRNLGKMGGVVNVKPGYGRNYLIPQGKAASATAANMAKFEARRAELEKHMAETLAAAQARASKLENMTITVRVKAGEEGKLFGSVGTREIVKAIHDAGIEVNKSEVILSEGTIRQVGEYPIQLQLHSDVSVDIKINVVPEE